jgi:hypothetical protein
LLLFSFLPWLSYVLLLLFLLLLQLELLLVLSLLLRELCLHAENVAYDS